MSKCDFNILLNEDSLEKYINLLSFKDKSCILIKNDEIVFEEKSLGVKPLRILRLKEINKDKDDLFILIDKIIGKAAVILALLLKVDIIYTPLASELALNFAIKNDIKLFAKEIVPFIENRTHDGMCPIENSVLNIDDLNLGEIEIERTIEKLMKA